MKAKFKFDGVNTQGDVASIGEPKAEYGTVRYSEAAEISNCDVDNDGNLLTRLGCSERVVSTASSFFNDGTNTFCILNNQLNRLVNTTFTPLDATSLLAHTEFVKANAVVVFSDGVTIGVIDSDLSVHIIAQSTDWTDVSDLETWVESHAPADPADGASNFNIDAFKLPTFAGKCLAFHEGALYLAVNNFVFKSKTFDLETMDIRYNVVAGFPNDVTVVAPVNGGVFVGTEGGTYYVGDDFQKKISTYPSLYGSCVEAPGEQVLALGLTGFLKVWSTAEGVFAGGDGGQFTNLSTKLRDMPTVGDSVTSQYRHRNGFHQYLICTNGVALVVNLNTKAHSRYTAYPYESLFAESGSYYGASGTRVVKFEGENDVAVPFESYIMSPNADMLLERKFQPEDVFLAVECDTPPTVSVIIDGVSYDATVLVGGDKKRGKFPRGLKGIRAQFKVSSTSSFKIYEAEVVINPLSRVV